MTLSGSRMDDDDADAARSSAACARAQLPPLPELARGATIVLVTWSTQEHWHAADEGCERAADELDGHDHGHRRGGGSLRVAHHVGSPSPQRRRPGLLQPAG